MPGAALSAYRSTGYRNSAESLPTVFYCQGYSGHGVNVTHLAGRIMADAVAGTVEQFDLFANVKPIVVPGAHWFSKPMVTLGMLYYQIKDRL